ncbi:hypothetical protein KR009_005238 [Drosophila setifemur]|nr:hypothetical protein KR009_005238 [Drosophila setifemur]
MEKYIGRFLERGYDSVAQCKQIVISDLVMLGVDDFSHRKLLLDGVQFLINSPEIFICSEPCELHNYVELELEPNPEPFFPKSTDSFSFLEAFNSLELDPEPPRKSGNPPYCKTKIIEKTEESTSTFFKAATVPTMKVRITYSCAACPHLKFPQMSDLEEHVALADDGVTHQCGVPLVETYTEMEAPNVVNIDFN